MGSVFRDHAVRLGGTERGPRAIDGLAQRARRVAQRKFAHQSQIVRMDIEERLFRGVCARGTLVGKAHRAFVVDEHVAGEHVAPARLCRAQAEVVLLAVAAPEALGVERPDLRSRQARRMYMQKPTAVGRSTVRPALVAAKSRSSAASPSVPGTPPVQPSNGYEQIVALLENGVDGADVRARVRRSRAGGRASRSPPRCRC